MLSNSATELEALLAKAALPVSVSGLVSAGEVPGEAAVLGERLDLKGRQTPQELREVFRGRLYPQLFRRELLLERRSPAPLAPSPASAPKP